MSLDELKGKVSALEAKVANWLKGTKATEGTESNKDDAKGAEQSPTLEGLSSTVATLEGRFTQLAGELATAKQTIGTLTTEKTTLEGKVTSLTNDLNGSKAKVTELEAKLNDPKGAIQTEAGKKAKDLVAGQGVPVDQLPEGQDGGGAGGKKAAAEKHYLKLIGEGKSLEAGEYWAQNQDLFK